MNPSVLEGYALRPAQLTDAEAILDLVNFNSMLLAGEEETSLKDLREELSDPDLDAERDTRVVFAPSGQLIAYAVVWNKGRPALPFVDVYLRASEWGREAAMTSFLLAWAEMRTLENLPQIAPDLRVAMRSFTDPRDEHYVAALQAAGFQPIRHSFQMAIEFDAPPQSPGLPDGFTLHIAERDDDPALTFDALRDAWRDHFGYIERPYDEALKSWRHQWEQNFAPGLWVLGMDGSTVAGMSICMPEFGGNPNLGYIQIVGVRRAYRRRGLAEALLRESFVRLAAAGKTGARLHVDGSSLTGATRVYERAGMHVHQRYVAYEKELRPGLDPSTTEAGVRN